MNQLKVGDKVHWTHVNQGKRSLSMRRRDGVIVSVDDKGAFVRYNRRTVWIELERLRTEFVEAMVEAEDDLAETESIEEDPDLGFHLESIDDDFVELRYGYPIEPESVDDDDDGRLTGYESFR